MRPTVHANINQTTSTSSWSSWKTLLWDSKSPLRPTNNNHALPFMSNSFDLAVRYGYSIRVTKGQWKDSFFVRITKSVESESSKQNHHRMDQIVTTTTKKKLMTTRDLWKRTKSERKRTKSNQVILLTPKPTCFDCAEQKKNLQFNSPGECFLPPV